MLLRHAVIALGVLAFAGAAHADVKMVSQMKGKMMGMNPSGETVTYIKGNKMRTDQTQGRNQTSTIMDVDSGRMVTLNHGKKEAEVWNMTEMSAALQQSGVSVEAAEVTVTPTGNTKQIAGYNATEHQMDVSVDAGIPDAPIKMTLHISGPAWLSTEAPGMQDYARFYQAAFDKGFFFGDPRAAQAQPGNARGMMKLYRDMAEKGIPLESTQTLKMSGSGPMAGILGRMGGGEMHTVVTSISTDTLDDSLFEVPSGYRVREQKVK